MPIWTIISEANLSSSILLIFSSFILTPPWVTNLLNSFLLLANPLLTIISDKLREEIAKELGVYDKVKQDGGWGNVSSKTCGNIVTKAIEIANRNANKN